MRWHVYKVPTLILAIISTYMYYHHARVTYNQNLETNSAQEPGLLRIDRTQIGSNFTVIKSLIDAKIGQGGEPVGRSSTCNQADKVSSFAFVKITKTGSTTLYAIMARFALRNKLDILSPKRCCQVSWHRKPGAAWGIGPKSHVKADVILNHARYNRQKLNTYLKEGYKLIVPVREPISWIQSAARFYSERGVVSVNSLDDIIQNNDSFYFNPPDNEMHLFHLKQLQYLGFDYKNWDSIPAMERFISNIVPRIDIPILTDQFDASLLILRRRFCWQYTDIFYQPDKVSNSNSEQLSPLSIKLLLSPQRNLGEKMLYDAINKTWWEQPEIHEKNFWNEVVYFSSLNRRVHTELCEGILRENKPYLLTATIFHEDIMLTVTFCKRLKQHKKGLMKCAINYALHNSTKSCIK